MPCRVLDIISPCLSSIASQKSIITHSSNSSEDEARSLLQLFNAYRNPDRKDTEPMNDQYPDKLAVRLHSIEIIDDNKFNKSRI